MLGCLAKPSVLESGGARAPDSAERGFFRPGQVMGIVADVILHLVDQPAFSRMLGMPIEEIAKGMESQSLRFLRPEPDPRFHRDFEVDLEGDLLELMDGLGDSGGFTPSSLQPRAQSSCEMLLLLARWCSSAQWRCWDARLFLYVEPALGREVSSAEELLHPALWNEFSDALTRTDRPSYSESVVMDWMSRRERLGETMEPSLDPRILPTMESHRSLSESLYVLLDQARRAGTSLLVGREYLEPEEWHLGVMTIAETMRDMP